MSLKRRIRNPRMRSGVATVAGPTFKPQKSGKGTNSWQLRQFAEATLGNGSLRKAVILPEGEDLNEWLAVNGRFSLWQSLGCYELKVKAVHY